MGVECLSIISLEAAFLHWEWLDLEVKLAPVRHHPHHHHHPHQNCLPQFFDLQVAGRSFIIHIKIVYNFLT